MTEHVCKYDGSYFGDGFTCIECGYTPGVAETIRKLNATERLSAEDASTAAIGIYRNEKHTILVKGALRAYANILEGKDE